MNRSDWHDNRFMMSSLAGGSLHSLYSHSSIWLCLGLSFTHSSNTVQFRPWTVLLDYRMVLLCTCEPSLVDQPASSTIRAATHTTTASPHYFHFHSNGMSTWQRFCNSPTLQYFCCVIMKHLVSIRAIRAPRHQNTIRDTNAKEPSPGIYFSPLLSTHFAVLFALCFNI